jgi:glycosyltransferase involved in cell wall biosynthesis
MNANRLLENPEMTLSIVTPSYNQGQFLAETIESVLSQAGDFALDYIIVDGGSTDGSVDIIRQYDEKLQRGEWPVRCRGIDFRWSSGPDRGQSDALVKGFRMARGSILAWLNSDDTYLPGALQTAVTFFREHPEAGLGYGDADYCDTNGTVISPYRTEPFDLDRLAVANIICQPAAFFRREAFEAVGGLDETLRFVMDYDLWIRIGRRFPCLHMPQRLATYRLHGSSKTVREETLRDNSAESLAVTIRHFGWAPLTRVYTDCRIRCGAALPEPLRGNHLALSLCALPCAVIRSIALNKGIRRKDLALFSWENLRKLSQSRLEIMTGSNRDGSGPV